MSKLLNWYYVNTIRNSISQSSDAQYEITNQPNVYQTYSDAIILRGKEVNRFVQIQKSIVIGTRFYVNLAGTVTFSVSCSAPRTFSCWVIADEVSESFYSLTSQSPYQTRDFSVNVVPNQTYTIYIVSETDNNPEDVFVNSVSTTKLYPYPNPFVYFAENDVLYATLSNLLNVQLERYQPFIVGAASTVTTSNLIPNRILISDNNGKIDNSSVSSLQLNQLSNIRGNVQDQIDIKQDSIIGAASSIVSTNLPSNKLLISDAFGKVAASQVSTTEISYLSGLTSNIQDQFNNIYTTKQDVITGAATTITTSNLTPGRILVSNSSGKVAIGNATATEVSHLSGVTSSVQGQLNFLSTTKQNTITGAASSVTLSNLVTNRIVISNAQGKIAASTISVSELLSLLNGSSSFGTLSNLTPLHVVITDSQGKLATGDISLSNLECLSGVTENIQTQLDFKQPFISGAASTVTLYDLDPELVVITDSQGKLATSTISLSNLLLLDGLTSNVQAQLDTKQLNITGAASSVTLSNLDPELVVVTDTQGKLATSTISLSNLLLLDGLTSNVQAQLDTKQLNITGAASSITLSNLDPDLVVITGPDGKLTTSTTPLSYLNYINTLNGNVQDQLDGKLSLTGGVVTGEVYIASTLTTCNLSVIGQSAMIDTINLLSSNLFIQNITGFGPALKVTQKSLDGSGHIAEFYDFDISTLNPVFAIADLGNVGIGTYDPTANFHVEGTIRFTHLASNHVIVTDPYSYITTSPVTTTELSYLSGANSSIQSQIDNIQNSFTGAVTTIISSNLTPSRILVSDANGKVGVGTVTSTELTYLAGSRENIQTQLDNIAGTFTGAVTTIISSNLTPSRILVSDANGKVGVGTVTNTELTYLSGVTSGIQTQIDSKQNTITGGATTITTANLTADRILVSDANGKVAVGSATTTELTYLSGVTSSIQTQINNKQNTITGGATTITTSNLTINRALISDANGKVAISPVTSTELGYLTGASSNIQGQINNIQNIANLSFIASGGCNIAGNVTLSNVVIRGSLLTNGGVGILGPTVLLQSANATTTSGGQISMASIGTYNGGICPFASVDVNGLAVTFNTEGVYRISCLKAVGDKSSAAQRTWTIRKLSSANATLDETTPQFTSIAGAEIGLRVGEKIAIINTGQSQSWYNVTPSLWSIIPLTIGYPG